MKVGTLSRPLHQLPHSIGGSGDKLLLNSHTPISPCSPQYLITSYMYPLILQKNYRDK